MWQSQAAESSSSLANFESSARAKGDEIQKLNVIETLPQLLAEDAHQCITRVVPKIQQSLPTASTEFHMAASVIFKQVLAQRLVSNATFTEVFLHSILSMLDNREPVISHAWLETILDVIELLPEDIIKREILPIAIIEGKISHPINSRITCCRLLGKISTRFDPNSVKKDVLPTVQALCHDVQSDVRACICLQLPLVGQGLGDNIMKILPFFVELANDEESTVRSAAIQTICHLLPRLQQDTIKDIIIPLIKMTCENAVKSEDNVIYTIAQEFGKIAQSSESYLTPVEKTWFIKYFTQLARMGIPSTNLDEPKKDIPLDFGHNQHIDDRTVECRRNCAFNLPAMFIFALTAPDGVISLISTLKNLANDSYYLVRRTIACCLHEIVKVLGSKSGQIKPEIVRLLKDDQEEVLQGLIPHVSEILELLLHHQLLGTDQSESSLDLRRALIKCETEISLTNNWRLSALMLKQLEVLPKCFASDFINTYLVPVVTNRILYSRPLPVRLAAGRTLLIFLRYSSKPQQKVEIRNQICNDFGGSSNCYVRMVFIRMMIEAMSIYSSMYFKEHFCSKLLTLLEDPVPNVRLKVITLVPTIKSSLRLPTDKKLLTTLETSMRNLMSIEKDRDVLAAGVIAVRKMDSIEVRIDSTLSPTKLSEYDLEDLKKYEEEKKLEAMGGGKATTISNVKKQSARISVSAQPTRRSDSPVRPMNKIKSQSTTESSKPVSPRPALTRQNALISDHSTDSIKASTSSEDQTTNWLRFTTNSSQSTQPWERATSSCHNTNLTSTNPTYITNTPSNEYSTQRVHCSCYELSDRIYRTQPFSSSNPLSNSPASAYHSEPCNCSCLRSSNYLKTTNLFYSKHDSYRFPEATKPSLITSGREDKHDIWQDLMTTRSSLANKYITNRTPDHSGFQFHHNGYWSFSSMPEIPVTLVDDEFMVDAGIRIPSQLSSSPSTSKVPNLQDIIYRNKKVNSVDRSRRFTSTFDRSKSFSLGLPSRFSLDYDDGGSGKAAPSSSSSSLISTSNRDSQYASQSSSDDRSKSGSISPPSRTHMSFDVVQRKALDDKAKRTSMLIDKDRGKPLQRSIIDRHKRNLTTAYAIRLPDAKESKMKFKRHSVETGDYPLDRSAVGRSLRRFSTLDVNHNQGLSKIPVRSAHITGSRTAPVTRTSSPIRVESELFEKLGFVPNNTKTYSHERRLRRFRSSDEEVDKLCQKF